MFFDTKNHYCYSAIVACFGSYFGCSRASRTACQKHEPAPLAARARATHSTGYAAVVCTARKPRDEQASQTTLHPLMGYQPPVYGLINHCIINWLLARGAEHD